MPGVALANVLLDPTNGRTDASGRPLVQTKITHDDGKSFFLLLFTLLLPPLTRAFVTSINLSHSFPSSLLGAVWDSLVPPTKDEEGNKYGCKKEDPSCSLHLHLITTTKNLGRVLSTPAAPGLLLGVGSVGGSLRPYEMCDTFLSEDGGRSWRVIRKGPHFWEVAEGGAKLVLIPSVGEVQQAQWSNDLGHTWTSISLGGVPIHPRALTAPETQRTRSFLLVASLSPDLAQENDRHRMYHLDFTHVHDRYCKDGEEDYQPWWDMEDGEKACLLGSTFGVWRRKVGQDCAPKEEVLARPLDQKPCRCTDKDFECDEGFSLKEGKGGPSCILDQDSSSILDPPPGACLKVGDIFWVSSGYRRIPGDQCEGGEDKSARVSKTCTEDMIKSPKDEGIRESRLILEEGELEEETLWMKGKGGFPWVRTSHGRILRPKPSFDGWEEAGPDPSSKVLSWFLQGDALYIELDKDGEEDQGEWWVKDEGQGSDWLKVPLPKDMSPGRTDLLPRSPSKPHDLLLVDGSGQGLWSRLGQGSKARWTRLFDHASDAMINECTWSGEEESLKKDQEIGIVCSVWGEETVKWWSSKKDGQGRRDLRARIKEGASGVPHGGRGLLEVWRWDIQYPSRRPRIIREGVDEVTRVRPNLYILTHPFKAGISLGANDTLSGMGMSISRDGARSFHDLTFPPNIAAVPDTTEGMTLLSGGMDALEAASPRIWVDVEGASIEEGGSLLVSGTEGSRGLWRVLEGTRRGDGGVEVERLRGMSGVWFGNVQGEKGPRGTRRVTRTRWSVDDGLTWQALEGPLHDAHGQERKCAQGGSGKCYLHLHGATPEDRSKSEEDGVYDVTWSGGLVMGVGHVGDESQGLGSREEASTFLSKNGGKTWTEIFEDPHHYGIGGGGRVIIAVGPQGKHLTYSKDGGSSWGGRFHWSSPMHVSSLTGVPGGKGLRWLIQGVKGTDEGGDAGKGRWILSYVDLTSLTSGSSCTSNDLEEWEPTVGETCVLGQKKQYWRPKLTQGICDLEGYGKGREAQSGVCPCSEMDYECAPGWWRGESGGCERRGTLDPDRPDPCPNGATYRGRTGWVPVRGSVCRGGVVLEEWKEWGCAEIPGISAQLTLFSSPTSDLLYFAKSSAVLMRTQDGSVFASRDEGASWQLVSAIEAGKEAGAVEEIIHFDAILSHPYDPSRAYLLRGEGSKVHYRSEDHGMTLERMEVPGSASRWVDGVGVGTISFHASHPDWLLYMASSAGCDDPLSKEDCYGEVHVTRDDGRSWSLVGSHVRHCQWAASVTFRPRTPDLIICEQWGQVSGPQPSKPTGQEEQGLHLVYTEDDHLPHPGDPSRGRRVVFERIVGFVLVQDYLLVAAYDDGEGGGKGLILKVSRDGEEYAQGVFPEGVDIRHSAYTVLESVGESVRLHVTVSGEKGKEYGSVLVSNSNGTYYHVALDQVNRDGRGFVDFERVVGLDGMALANVLRPGSLEEGGNGKVLQSRMTRDNGASWFPLTPPEKDSLGQAYPGCSKQGSECHLHLHSYTELEDAENIFSASSAKGLLVGIGNVGSSLGTLSSSSSTNSLATFLTRDAGRSWKEVRKGAFHHEIGDHGALLILAPMYEPTDKVLYSLDGGGHFEELYVTSPGEKVQVDLLTTEANSTSRRFLLLGRAIMDKGKALPGKEKHLVIRLDFAGASERQCHLDPDLPGTDDFEIWSPSSSLDALNGADETCLLGKVSTYWRRREGRVCWMGKDFVFPKERSASRNCSCTRADYECDYNYVLRGAENGTLAGSRTGECVLAQGLSPRQPQCVDGQASYLTPTGYRKIPLNGCAGGNELDVLGADRLPCPGYSGGGGSGWFWFGLLALGGGAWFWLRRRRGGSGARRRSGGSSYTQWDVSRGLRFLRKLKDIGKKWWSKTAGSYLPLRPSGIRLGEQGDEDDLGLSDLEEYDMYGLGGEDALLGNEAEDEDGGDEEEDLSNGGYHGPLRI